jgi:hypothetical protein
MFQTDAAVAPSHVGGKVKPRTDHRAPSSTGTPTDASVDEQIVANMDGGWKRLMEQYFKEFFRFFFPAISRGN